MTYSDIVSKVNFLTKTNSSSFPLTQLVIEANNALERVSSLIMQADGRWQFDDSNQTDLPIATAALVSGQQDYSLAVSHLNIIRLEVQSASGAWTKLQPIDTVDIYDKAMTEFLKTQGTPLYYDKMGSSFFLYPAPNYSQAASLRIYYKRPPSYFVYNDTTKAPGFNSLYHDLIPLWVAYNYSIANGIQTANAFMTEIERKEQALLDDYSLRDKDDVPRLAARRSPSIYNWFR